MSLKFMCPLMLVEDIERSRGFYENVLGRKVKDDFGVNVCFEGDFAIHLKAHFEEVAKLKGKNAIVFGSNSFDLVFETSDLDGMYERLRTNGVEFLHEIEEQPWGQRVLRCYDPDRHLLEIGETMESVVVRLYERGKTVEEIVRQTAMSKDFVETALKEAH